MHGGMATHSASATLLFPAAAGAAATTAPACPPSTRSKSTAATGRPSHGHRRRRQSMSCSATGADDDGSSSRSHSRLWLPRRDVLAGLTTTGVAAAGLTAYPGAGLAELAKVYECRRGDSKVTDDLLGCDVLSGLPCPPRPGKDVEVVDFVPPKSGKPLRVRRPAHALSEKEIAGYRKALARMRAAPEDDPSSFAQQAAIHEAYCDGHYHVDPTTKNRAFDVHFTWIFAPWHRMYIYFYERMVNHHMDAGDIDGEFALPYWSWDAPAGMALPAMFKNPAGPANSLYDVSRNKNNVDALVDLDYLNRANNSLLNQNVVDRNLSIMYHQMVRSGKGAKCFLGDKYCTEASFATNEINTRSRRRNEGNKIKKGSPGTLERMAHTAVHVWLGDPCSKALGHDGKEHDGADMGFLGSAARDPVFYSHHANVDRMWHLWNTKLGGANFDDPEWLDTSFLFYDFADDGNGAGKGGGAKKPRLVRIRVRDVLDTSNLGYTYDDDDSPKLEWMNRRPSRSLVPASPPAAAATPPVQKPAFPVELTPCESVLVPSVARPADLAPGEEVLVIKGIEIDPSRSVKFDVAINVPREQAAAVRPEYKEYAGSFASVQSAKEKPGNTVVTTQLAVPISDVLADLGVKGGEPISVAIVPRTEGVTLTAEPEIIKQQFC